MSESDLVALVKRHEGLRLKPYRCTAGKLTIGWGRNLDDRGITRAEAEFLLGNDLTLAEMDLKQLFPRPFPRGLTLRRWHALIDMRHQLGPAGFRSFRRMIEAVRRDDWAEASRQALDSKWARQDTPERAREIADRLLHG